MRRAVSALFFCLFLFTAIFSCTVSAAADALNTAELSEWSGTALKRLEKDNILCHESAGTSYIEFDTDKMRSVFIYCDAGNYSGRGKGRIIAECIDGDGNVALSYSSEIADDGYFRHYALGTDTLYAGLPENTQKLRLSLVSDSGDGPYFKNINIFLSGTAAYDTTVSEWIVSGNIGLVEVNVTRAEYLVMVGMVFAAALIMLGVRKYIDRIKGKK